MVPGLNELARDIYLANDAKGFWPDNPHERNKGELLMLVTSELAEGLEALRKGRTCEANLDVFEEILEGRHGAMSNQDFAFAFKDAIKDTFEDEIADAMIRLLDMCGALGIDIERHIKFKLEYNATRPAKHGKAF